MGGLKQGIAVVIAFAILASGANLRAEPVFAGDRPDVLKITEPRNRLPEQLAARAGAPTVSRRFGNIPLDNVLRANLEVAAQIDLYRGYNKVFIGRPTKHIRDLYLLLSGAEERGRVIDADVSRRITGDYGTDPHLNDYLVQQGITLEKLERGEKFLIVDDVGSGKFFDRVVASFPAKYRGQFQSHFFALALGEGNPHPESRVFHLALHPDQAIDRSRYLLNFKNYDLLPQFSGWAHQIVNVGTAEKPRWDSVSKPRESWEEATAASRPRALDAGSSTDHAIWVSEQKNYDPSGAEAFQEHQAWWAKQGTTIELWQQRQKLNDALVRMRDNLVAMKGTPGEKYPRYLKEMVPALNMLLSDPEYRHDPYVRAAILDFCAMAQRNFPNSGIRDNPGVLKVDNLPLTAQLDPVAIRQGADPVTEARASALRRARGELPFPERLSAVELMRVRTAALDELTRDHFGNAEVRTYLVELMRGEDTTPALRTHLANNFPFASARAEHTVELLKAAAEILPSPITLVEGERARALAAFLDRGGAESLIPEEFFYSMVALEVAIEEAGKQPHEHRDPSEMTADERRAYFQRSKIRNLGRAAEVALRICKVTYRRMAPNAGAK